MRGNLSHRYCHGQQRSGIAEVDGGNSEIVCLPNDVRAGGQVAVEDCLEGQRRGSPNFQLLAQIEGFKSSDREVKCRNSGSQDLPVRPASETRSVKPMVNVFKSEDRDEVIERS